MSQPSRVPGPRPLLGGTALFALLVGALLLFGVLLPMSRARLQKAEQAAPSSLSLRYLELHLSREPGNAELRKALVQKLVDSGQLDEARRTFLPLLEPAAAPSVEVYEQLVQLDRARWAAMPDRDVAGRQAALEQLRQSVRELEAHGPPLAALTRIAELYRELDQPLLAAELLDRLARRGLPDVEARAAAADAAWLAAGAPDKAAELQASLAELRGLNALAHARTAIERARSLGQPSATAAMIDRMRARFPEDRELLQLALRTAEGYSVARGYELALELLRISPNVPEAHREVARLAEATGRSLRALDEYVWLVRHGGDEQDRARAIALAKANWDLRLVRELSEGRRGKTPSGPSAPQGRLRRGGSPRCQASPSAARRQPRAAALRALRERVALDEALGDDRAALRKLTAALSGELGQRPELWQQKLELELTLGDTRAALATAQGMRQRFGNGRTASERVAGLQLALGDLPGALATLRAAQLSAADEDEPWLTRLASLAFQAGDVDVERAAYQKLIALPTAAPWQYQRLYELAVDSASALRVALAAFERFESEPMLYAALAIYQARGALDERAELLAQAERCPAVSARQDYWQARIALHAERARGAQARGERVRAEYARAKRELDEADRLRERAEQRGALSEDVAHALADSTAAQRLSLGLASDDALLIERGYRARESRLSSRERVYVLQKLGRSEEALALAQASLEDSSLSEVDRGVLLSDARALSAGTTRYLRVRGDALQMDGLASLGSTATLEYGGKRGGLRADVGFTRLEPRDAPDRVLDDETRDVTGSLSGRLGRAALELGVHVRDERSLRPFGAFALQLAGTPEAGALLRARVHSASTDTARLRALGVRDAAEAELALPFAHRFYVSAKGSAEAYYTRQERTYLGAGLNLDAGVGASLPLPASLGAFGLRLAGRVAPRFAHDAATDPALAKVWLPQSSEWAGVGASLGKGSLELPPRFGRSFCYLLDGAAGYLWPLSGLGFSAQAGLGVSLLGEDLLTIAARGGNVVGSTAWSANLGYALSIR